jgi:hypothetical protein
MATGDMEWYQHLGRSNGKQTLANGTTAWTNNGQPRHVGNGWNGYKLVFPADDGVIYGLTPNGRLNWYQHLGRSEGDSDWANNGQPTSLGDGWDYREMFAAEDGVIYAIDNAGQMWWYQHLGRSNGLNIWAKNGQRQQLLGGWNYTQTFAASDSVIYGVNHTTGALNWYRHIDRSNGGNTWVNGGTAIQVSNGWNNVDQVFPADNSVLYAVNPAGELLWYRHYGLSNIGQQGSTSTWVGPHKVGIGFNGRKAFAAGDGVIYTVLN